ncbi:ATP-binding protein [Catenibacterium mitsuokai]|uniref:ATP-binding protein n=1 Tax=Catenibacterium mitsuokai TaxID=100886 RepID=UPI00319E4444
MENYKARIIDKKIDKYLSVFGAICIEGPKWCGKTWTSSYHSNSEIYIGDPSGNFQNRQLAQMSPSLVLDGETPRLIDEWQEVPPLWDAVRYKVDQVPKKGQFILTGSATPNHKGILHSGAGRIARIRMRTMSLYESGDSSGDVSLEDLCNGKLTPKMTGEVDLKNVIEFIIRGGWPASLGLPIESAALLPKEYLEAVLNDDIYRVDGVKRNTHKMRLLLRSLARNESTTVSNKTLKNDIKEIDDEDIDTATIADYLNILDRLFITDNQKPFSTKIRSSVRIKQSEKRHFCDPSLACALLNITPHMLLNDLETLGFLFESLCERDLKIYAESIDAHVYHYQDYKNREIDTIIELNDGRWCAIEIKLGANQIESAAENLKKIYEEMEKDPKSILPSAMIIVCGLSNAAYQREDGIYVVPLTALKD